MGRLKTRNLTPRGHQNSTRCPPLLYGAASSSLAMSVSTIFKIVETDIARLDDAAPYSKGGHRETCFSVRVDAHFKFMFDARSII